MGKTILVVDDDPMNVRMAEFALKKNSYDVVTANSGPECLEKIQENNVDLVLLDIEMPQMNGIETFEQIRADSNFANLPIVFLTASGDGDNVQKAKELGAADYLKKPFLPPDLLKCVGEVLDK